MHVIAAKLHPKALVENERRQPESGIVLLFAHTKILPRHPGRSQHQLPAIRRATPSARIGGILPSFYSVGELSDTKIMPRQLIHLFSGRKAACDRPYSAAARNSSKHA